MALLQEMVMVQVGTASSLPCFLFLYGQEIQHDFGTKGKGKRTKNGLGPDLLEQAVLRVAERRMAEGKGQDSGKEPSVPFWKCYIWEIQELAVRQPAAASSHPGPALGAKKLRFC